MQWRFTDKALEKIAEKVDVGERLSFDDGLALEASGDFLGVGALANAVREKKNGNDAFYINNRHINHTNICVNTCRFCAFSRKEGDDGAYAMSIAKVMEDAHKHDGEKLFRVSHSRRPSSRFPL